MQSSPVPKQDHDLAPLSNRQPGSGRLLAPEGPNSATPSRVLYLEPVQAPPVRSQQPTLSELLFTIRSHFRLFLILGTVGVLLGIIVAFLQEPEYQTKTAFAIQTHTESAPNIKLSDSDAGNLVNGAGSYLQAQAWILESKSLRAAVVAKLRQQHRQWHFTPTDRFAIIRTKLRRRASKPKPGLPPVATQVKVLENAGVIEITATSTNPQFAAAYANAMVQEYVDSQLSSGEVAAKRNLLWVMRQLDNLKEKLQTAENGLQAYGHAAGVIVTPEHANTGSEELMQMQAELSRAEVDRMLKESAYEVASSSPIESLPQVIENPRISEYQSKLADLKRELADMKVQFTPEYPKVARIQAQINELQAALNREQKSIVDAIHNEYLAAEKREDLLKGAYASQEQQVLDRTDKAVSYDIQRHEVESLRGLYDELLKKAQTGLVTSASQSDWVRVIDQADPPGAPFKPDLFKTIVMGWAFCTFCGVFFVVGRRFVRSNFTAPGQTAVRLDIPELGAIPDLNSLAQSRIPTRRRSIVSAEAHELHDKSSITNWGYRPTIAEAYRGAVASLLGSKGRDQNVKVILATSAHRGEGKSSTISNLGIALAEIGKKTVVIDADLRKPRLHEIFDVPNNWGLSTILSEQNSLPEMPIESLVRGTEVDNLWLLTSGPGVDNISNLFYSNRADELIGRLRQEFEVILIDTPPLIGLADARMIGRLADGAILILRAGRTSVDTALYAKEQLQRDGIHLIGSVLNGWNIRSTGPYGYYYSGDGNYAY